MSDLSTIHTAFTDLWKMYKTVRLGEQSLSWAVMEGDRIVKASGNNLMIRDMVFAAWNELDRTAHAQMDMKDELYGQPLNR